MRISERDILKTENPLAYNDKAKVLRDVKDVTAILRVNGDRKTTLMRAICVLVRT